MADSNIKGKPISDFQEIETIPDDSFFVAEYLSKAYKLSGAVIRKIIEEICKKNGSVGGIVAELTGSNGSYNVTVDGTAADSSALNESLQSGANVIGIAGEDMIFVLQTGIEYTIPAGTVFRYQNANVYELVGESYEFYAQLDGHEFAVIDMDGNWYGHCRPAQVVLYLKDSGGNPVVYYNGRSRTAEEVIDLLENCYNMGRPVLCWQENMSFLQSDGLTVTPPLGNVFRLTRSSENLFAFKCEHEGMEYVVEVNDNGFVPYAEKVSYGISADSLSLTINPVDGKIYITVNGVMVGQGVQGGAPVSYGDVEVDNMILKLNNGQSVTFNVRLSEPPTNPQIVTILSDSEHITFDKSKLTFTADNYDTYQTVTASAAGVTKDGTASIIVRNSDELLTDFFITVYLKAEFYNVDTTIPTEGQHIVTMDDFESSSPIGNYIRLYHYIGEYDNIVIPAELDGKIPQICPGKDAGSTTTFWSSGTALKYVTFADDVVIRGAGSTSGGSASSLFKGFTSLIGVSNMNPNVTDLNVAFSGCTSLKFIDNLHELTNVTALNEAFTESGIEYLPDLSGMTAVTNMNEWVKNCTALKRVYGMPVPATSCTTNQLFNGCSALEKAEVPQNATTMFYCFNGCTSLREVTVHATGITAATSAFKDCTDLTVYLDADTTTYDTLIGLYGSSTDVTFVTDGGASAPSIVVWGDSTSSPNRAWKEWPARLQEAVSTYLVKNQAASGEFTTSTSARQGGNALSVGAFTIPADTSAVGITLKSSDGHTFGADPVFSAAHSFNPCTISGVQGTISRSGSSYTFTRTNAGEVVEVAEGAIVTSDADDLFNNADAVMLVNIGINSGWDEDADVLLNQVQLMVNHFTAKGGTKYIITGPYAGQFLLTDEIRQTVFSYEKKAATAFGEHWLNLREYLIENGLTENGLTATATDTERMALGQIPGSLLGGGSTTNIQMYPDTSSDQTHPNAYGQNSIFNAFYAKGVALGYWE